MTKNKRFVLVKCYNEQWGVVDISLEGTDQLVLITTNKSGTLYIINELNAINDENNQLKQAISDWKGSYDELYSNNKILEKENEKLKSEKQAIIDILNEMENGNYFWDRDYLIECISDIETAIGFDLDD